MHGVSLLTVGKFPQFLARHLARGRSRKVHDKDVLARSIEAGDLLTYVLVQLCAKVFVVVESGRQLDDRHHSLAPLLFCG